MLDIVTFLWTKPGYRSAYTMEHVYTLERMIRRHYHGGPWMLHVFSDQSGQTLPADSMVLVRPLWDTHANVPNPHGAQNPSCYRRMRMYSDWARENIGPRILQLDLDMVITGDVTPLWDRTEPFVFWEDQLNRHNKINGAMQLITPGLRPDIWEDFDPLNSPREALKAGNWGSDQAWLSHKLKGQWARWTAGDGAYSWRVHCLPQNGELPAGARIVNFHGAHDPWGPEAQRLEWVRDNYR